MIKEIEINSFEELMKELLKVPKDYKCITALGDDCSGIVNHLTINSEKKRSSNMGKFLITIYS